MVPSKLDENELSFLITMRDHFAEHLLRCLCSLSAGALHFGNAVWLSNDNPNVDYAAAPNSQPLTGCFAELASHLPTTRIKTRRTLSSGRFSARAKSRPHTTRRMWNFPFSSQPSAQALSFGAYFVVSTMRVVMPTPSVPASQVRSAIPYASWRDTR